jgi:hypothetical protein
MKPSDAGIIKSIIEKEIYRTTTKVIYIIIRLRERMLHFTGQILSKKIIGMWRC